MKMKGLIAVLSGFAASANAALILDTGPGVAIGLPMDNLLLLSGGRFAGRFTLSSAYEITSAQGWLGSSWYDVVAGELDINIYADGTNGYPGSALYHTQVDVPALNEEQWYGASDLSWALGAGTYWLAFEVPEDSLLQMVTVQNASSPLDLYSVFLVPPYGDNAWGFDYGELSFAARLEGESVTPVPAPSSVVLLATGLLMGAAYRNLARKKRS